MKKIVLSALLILFTACATNSYNIPFVNVDETIQLREGMSRNEVLNTMGNPYYVESGEMGIIVWVYEIRAVEVKSDNSSDDTIPNKTHSTHRDSTPIHRLEVVFVDDKLESWDMQEETL